MKTKKRHPIIFSQQFTSKPADESKHSGISKASIGSDRSVMCKASVGSGSAGSKDPKSSAGSQISKNSKDLKDSKGFKDPKDFKISTGSKASKGSKRSGIFRHSLRHRFSLRISALLAGSSRKYLPNRSQILCLAAAFLLAGLSLLSERENSILKDGAQIARSGYGGARQEVSLFVEGIEETPVPVTVGILPRSYTKEAALEAFARLEEQIPPHILGDNTSLQAVQTDLRLVTSVSGFPGIRLQWYPEDPDLISYDGSVDAGKLKTPVQTSLTLSLSAGDVRREYSIPVRVLPYAADSREAREEKLQQAIRAANELGTEDETLQLPQSLDGVPLHYRTERSQTPLFILMLGVLAAALLRMKPEQDRRAQKKAREKELLADYSELVSKLLVYIGAGLTIRNAWAKLAEIYTAQREAGAVQKRCAYEEVLQTHRELLQGISESRAYTAFARRCGLKCYIRLGALLEQNRKTGDDALRGLLTAEMQDAFEQRKNLARRLGEEAGTKLMVPLMLSLASLLMMIMVPTMLSMQ